MDSSTFTADYDDAAQLLTVTGEVDEAASTTLRELIGSSTADHSRSIGIDLTAVTYLPSVAVGILARTQKDAADAGHPVDLLATDGTIAQRVLQVCGLPHRKD